MAKSTKYDDESSIWKEDASGNMVGEIHLRGGNLVTLFPYKGYLPQEALKWRQCDIESVDIDPSSFTVELKDQSLHEIYGQACAYVTNGN